ncbi:preprotein translocase subunit SecE [Ostreibacterium oceani]|uniref:Protein translocase subunit SecE n=1 Tax=Ostreibacterium oceani TaxID=2654998 RepID=A0A6N7F044_9GAMM|nr:preprotein translocase subunit SecE [Ostreibacterium oceani]MPV86999.1 preprotein translocase subunit SecE [Ostreibacterium oceani]
MSDAQSKSPIARSKTAHGSHERKAEKGKFDIVFILLSVCLVALALYFVPRALASTGVGFLSDGSGMSKLISVVTAALLGWVALLPAQSYKRIVELLKGGRIEWRKTVKPDRDTVTKTTMMVLAISIFLALLILLIDSLFGWIVRIIIN